MLLSIFSSSVPRHLSVHSTPPAVLASVITVFPSPFDKSGNLVRFLAASPAVFGAVSSSSRVFGESNIRAKDDRFQIIKPESQGFQADFSSSRLYFSVLLSA
jgi:hypothetical protein